MNQIPICSCGERECEKFGGQTKGYRKICWKCRQFKPNPNAYRKRKRDDKTRCKKQAIEGYGSKCACCGETEIIFLTIDHVNGKGAEHRRENGIHAGASTYRFVINNNFPKEFQVLCWNCNTGRYINGGVCPHKISK